MAEEHMLARLNEVIAEAIEAYDANPPEPFVPERLRPALDLLPDDFVIVPRFCVENIRDAAHVDLEARDGYGGAVVGRERAMDGFWFYHMFVSSLDGDYDVYEEFYGPNA